LHEETIELPVRLQEGRITLFYEDDVEVRTGYNHHAEILNYRRKHGLPRALPTEPLPPKIQADLDRLLERQRRAEHGSAPAAHVAGISQTRTPLHPVSMGLPVFAVKLEPATREITPGYEADGRAGVLVFTKIREDYPQDDSVLDKVTPRHQSMQQHFGKDLVQLRGFDVNGRRIEELVTVNVAYDQFFPYGAAIDRQKKAVESIAVSQIGVADGLLIECALFRKLPADADVETAIETLRTECQAWLLSIARAPESEGDRGAGDGQ
jgi:hypothetical protein